MESISEGLRIDATVDGIASESIRSASSRPRVPLISLRRRRPRLRSASVFIRYITPSTIPQARLQPRAAKTMVRISCRPAVAALTVQVNESTMMKPNRISMQRSTGSRTRLRASLLSLAALVSMASEPQGGYEVEHQGDDRVDGHQLDSAVPVGSPIAGHHHRDEHRQEQGAYFGPVERQMKRLRSHEIACQDQDGGYEQGDLDGASEHDSQRQIHLVPQGHGHGGPAFRCAADDRQENDPDEGRRHAQGLAGALRGAHQDFA